MLKEKAGVIAGQIWEALNETEGSRQGLVLGIGLVAERG